MNIRMFAMSLFWTFLLGFVSFVPNKSEATEHINVVKSANYRDVRVELTYQIRDEKIDHPRIKISKENKVLFEELISYEDRVVYEDISLPTATDLNGDWEPEIIVSLALNEKGQLNESVVYYWDKQENRYQPIKRSWDDKSLVSDIQDVNKDGIPEFITYNVNFLSEFVESTDELIAPVKVWKFEEGNFIDKTSDYKEFVYQHAVSVWHKFDQLRKAKLIDQDSIKAILASYVADKYSLGQSDDAWKRLEQVYQFKDSKMYFDTLKDILLESGYVDSEQKKN